MYRTQGVWGLIALYMGLAHCFFWDIFVARSNRLEFYSEGTPAAHRIINDPVHAKVLFADKHKHENSATSFEKVIKNTQTLIKSDPATELLFGAGMNKIYSLSIKRKKRTIDLESVIPQKVAVDSCDGCNADAGSNGEIYNVSLCQNYCFQGDCFVIDEQPKCRCKAGYSGERCEIYACYKYCLNNGVCSLNKKNEPVCHCTRQYEGDRCTAFRIGLHWLPLLDGKLPPNALVGGFENEDIYIARAYHSGSLCPGKYVKSLGKAFVAWGGGEHSKDEFEILCGYNAKWVQVNSTYIPQNAFIGGRTGGAIEVDGDPLYIGRAWVDGSLVCGKAYGRTHLCYLPYKGGEITTSSYEILVKPDEEITTK